VSVDDILQTRGLGKTFGGLNAVSDVDLSVATGEIHCLIGPNGAGKSTLFKLIVGTYPPTHGNIVFRGRDVTGHLPFQRVKEGMSIKMQTPSVFRELPVRQNLHVALQHHVARHELDREEQRLLELLELSGDAGKPAGALSHGQQQWLEIGMALALKPALLLLDEPTAGMSPEETASTIELIRRLTGELGLTILFCEHDMDVVFNVANRIMVMQHGRTITQGAPGEVRRNTTVQEAYLGEG